MSKSKFKNSIKFKTIKSVLIGFIMAIIFGAGLFFGKTNSYSYKALSYRALSHSGGTDSSGCHCVGGKSSNGSCPSGNYHCH
ncbi:MAG: hypothetical protein ACR2M7_01985 [Bdellovibrionales bacterium]